MVRHHPATVVTRVRIPVDALDMFFDADFKAKGTDWKKFEDDVAQLFVQFDYDVEQDLRLNKPRRFQIDLIAHDRDRCFIIDCKDHSYISPGREEDFINNQVARATALVTKRKEIGQKKIFVLLVTRNRSSSLLKYDSLGGKIYGVDIKSLPDLLRNLDLYEDALLSISDKHYT